MTAKLSVVIPAFNNQHALDKSIATLKAQTVRPHEVIVVDDGSGRMIDVPKWVRLARIERLPNHRGSSAAKNYGASLAVGDWLVFADSDILHLPDAIESLTAAAEEWDDNTLINVMRIGLPRDYPEKYYDKFDVLMRNCRTAGLLVDEDRELSIVCWEQNCGMIRRDYFWKLGGYDETGFPSWGFNNQDLDCRVILSGGHVTSNIARSSDGKRLYCFHIWHENNCDKEKAAAEWQSKWGEPFSDSFVRHLRGLVESGDVSKYQHNVVRKAA